MREAPFLEEGGFLHAAKSTLDKSLKNDYGRKNCAPAAWRDKN